MTILGIWILALVLRALRFPVLREIPWPWLFLWPLVAWVLMFVIRILEYIFYFLFFIGFMWLLVWLWNVW